MKIPVSKPYLTQNGLANLSRAYESTFISNAGEFIDICEQKCKLLSGCEFNSLVSNGTVAIQLAIEALDLPKGSKIVIPNFTFGAVYNAVVAQGHVPVLCDIDRCTWLIDLNEVDRLCFEDPEISCLIAVHSYGNPLDASMLDYLKGKFSIKIIEDCAEAHGASSGLRKVGSIGDIACFSFFANKVITSGEGGLVSTNSELYFTRIETLKNHGMDKLVKYRHLMPGYNFRITNLQAAVLEDQLLNFQTFLENRNRLFELYKSELSQYIEIPELSHPIANRINWLFSFSLNTENERNFIISFLREKGIETRTVFSPISSYPFVNSSQVFPNTLTVSRIGMSLPTYTNMSELEFQYIIENFIKAYEKYNR